MKPLKPSMREHKRYLLVKGSINEIQKAIQDFIGVLGMSKIGLIWVKKNKDSAVIGVNRESLNHVRASFAVWDKKISVEKVSGTLRGLGMKNGN